MSSDTLVTGAAGFAGSHLIDLLVRSGVSPIAWHRPGGSPPRDGAGARWEAVDLLDRELKVLALKRHVTVNDLILEFIAVRADVAAVKAKLTLVEHRLLIRLGGLMIVVGAALFAVLCYWPPSGHR